MAAIDLTDLSVTFTVRQQKRVTFKEYLVKGLFRTSVNPAMQIHALSGINLAARDGDRIGVIGHNGAGKSTLLKTIAGVYPPTAGTRAVEGRICSLFDITLGFEAEASGWDNIVYRSYLQGETPKTLQGKLEAIGEFTELGDYLNLPVRHYSSGMMMRLAFSIATNVAPEVLLVDEVLAVGDMAFQLKARKKMHEMMGSASLMVLVAHDLATVQEMCNRVIWMRQGSVVMEGPTNMVIDSYVENVELEARSQQAAEAKARAEAEQAVGDGRSAAA
jgi:ABC-type polysaccharide/polyol phosphate transport system ATPase subunit